MVLVLSLDVTGSSQSTTTKARMGLKCFLFDVTDGRSESRMELGLTYANADVSVYAWAP